MILSCDSRALTPRSLRNRIGVDSKHLADIKISRMCIETTLSQLLLKIEILVYVICGGSGVCAQTSERLGLFREFRFGHGELHGQPPM